MQDVPPSDWTDLSRAEEACDGDFGMRLLEHRDVVIRCTEEASAPSVAGEEECTFRPAARRQGAGFEQPAQVLVGAAGIPEVELHRCPDGDDVADGDGAVLLVDAEQVTDPEVSLAEVGPRLVDDDPDLQAALGELPARIVKGAEGVYEPLECRLPGEFDDLVRLGGSDDQWRSDRAAPLRDHGVDSNRSVEAQDYSAPVEDVPVDAEPCRAWTCAPGGEPSDAGRFPPGGSPVSPLCRQPFQPGAGGKRERVRQHDEAPQCRPGSRALPGTRAHRRRTRPRT